MHAFDTHFQGLPGHDETSVFDDFDDVPWRAFSGSEINPRPFGRQIDTGPDTRQGIEQFFDPRGAGRAVHATDGEVEAGRDG